MLIVFDAVGVGGALGDRDAGVQGGPEKGGRDLADAAAVVQDGAARFNDVGLFIARGAGDVADGVDKRKGFARGDEDAVNSGGGQADVINSIGDRMSKIGDAFAD